MLHKTSHVDEKVLTPLDNSKSNFTKDALISEGYTAAEASNHIDKPIRGHVIITNNNTGEVLETPNLVLLSGREFLAQKLSDTAGNSLLPAGSLDLTKFKISYFGVGTGGADTADQPNKIGPFDNELDLRDPGKFANVSIDTDSTLNMGQRYQYLDNGKLKKITTDGGSIEIIQEDHEIIITGGQTVIIPAFTTIKYTMIINNTELFKDVNNGGTGPFAFNEAALYAVEHEIDSSTDTDYSVPAKTDGSMTSRYQPHYRAFARFTALTKWLEESDSLRIEWFILV